MTDPIVEAVDVVKLLGNGAAQVQALKGVSLALKRGELTLLMGPSGSGKTTLLSILGCILRASEGNLEILGEDVSALREKELPRIRREAIGFVFQGFNLFPALTAAENVALALDVRGVRGGGTRDSREKSCLRKWGWRRKQDRFPRI